jgi:uncharacterized protein (TIGR02328 family)
MRLWHKDLIPYLPRQQLLAQWRECCAIASNIANKGTPNHLLVNKVIKYDILHFISYTYWIKEEMKKRGYKISEKTDNNFVNNLECVYGGLPFVTKVYPTNKLYKLWHNERYLKQCLFNLQEKFDCGGISKDEWKVIEDKFGYLME